MAQKKSVDETETLKKRILELEEKLTKSQELNNRLSSENRAVTLERKALESVSDMGFEAIFLSQKGVCVGQNTIAEKMFGYTAEEALGQPGTNWIAPEDRDMVLSKILKGDESPYLATALRKDKSQFPVQIIGKMINFEEEAYRVTSLVDITEKVKAQSAVETTESKYKTLFEGISDAIFIHEIDGKKYGNFTEVNDAACKMYGYTKEEFFSLSPGDFSRFKELKILNKHKYGMNDGWELFEEDHRKKDGSIFPVEVHATAIKIGGKPVIMSLVRDITGRKSSLESLRKSEEKFRLLFEKNSAIELIINPATGEIIDANKAAENFYGWSISKLKAMNISEINTLTPENIKKEMARVTKDEKNFFEFRHRLSDGTIADVEVYSSAIKTGEANYLYSIIHDVSQRKKAEKELQKQSQATEQSPVSVIITNVDGLIEYVNPKFTKVTGYTLEEAQDKTPRILKSGMQEDKFYENLWETILDGNIWQGEIQNKRKNGELYWEKAIISPVKSANGKTTHFLGIKEDITEKRKLMDDLIIAKERAEENEAKFSAITNQSSEGITVTDINGHYAYVNPAFCEMTQYAKDELMKMTAYEMAVKDQKVESYFANKEKMEGVPFRIKLRRKDGSEFLAEVIGKEITIHNKKSALGIIRDVTKRAQAEEDLLIAKQKAEESSRFKTNFIHNLSHEIRTPMNGIMGFSYFLSKPNISQAQQVQYINIIQRSGKQLLRIIDDLLEISQLDSGNPVVTEGEFNLNILNNELFKVFDVQAKEKALSLYLKNGLNLEESAICSDESKLKKILSNLLENAIKFTEIGFVEFGYALDKTHDEPVLKLYVKDTGIGINRDRLEVIFERFSQGGTVFKSKLRMGD